MTSIIDLPTDIVRLIFDRLPLSSHFDFACTCKRLAAASAYILQRHQNAYNKFRVASDRDPTTVPLLLQSAFGKDSITAWHVRSFEVWRDRTSWEEWETYSLHTPIEFGLDGGVSDLDILGFKPLLERVGDYLDWYEEECSHGDFKREKASTQIESGHDGVLKALLFAKLPRLQDLKLVTRSQATGSTLSWLKALIAASKGIHSPSQRVRPEFESSEDTDSDNTSARDEPVEECKDVVNTRENYERLLQSIYDDCQDATESQFDREWDRNYKNWLQDQGILRSDDMEVCEPAEEEKEQEEDEVTEDCKHGEELLQKQMDAIDTGRSQTADEFEREWEVSTAKWTEKQELEKLEKMEVCESEMQAKSAQDIEMDLCEADIVSNNSQDHEAEPDGDTPSESAVDTGLWPPGFASLRSVAVGVVSGTWMDDEQYPKSAALTARLLRLPNIVTLYFNGFRHDYDDGDPEFEFVNDNDSDAGNEYEDYDFDIFDFSSSVKHLFFEGLGYTYDEDFEEWLFGGPRKLLTAAFRNSGPDAGDFQVGTLVRELGKAQGSNLQSLMWYGYDSGSIQCGSGEGSVLCLAEDELDGFDVLKQLSFNVHDLSTGLEHTHWGDVPDGYDSYDDYYVDYIVETLPSSLECLVLWEDAGSGLCGDREGETVLLERAIIKMIEGDTHKNLKAVMLEQVERATEHGAGKVSFDKAIAAGKAAGVDVYTLANRPKQNPISFPEPVDQYDLKTGKHPGGRPADWVFNSYTGCREPPRNSEIDGPQP